MRALLVVIAVAAAGCGGAPATAPKAGTLTLHLTFAPLLGPAGDVTVTAARLHLDGLTAVSDRSATDARAALQPFDLVLGDDRALPLPTAPPGLYSSVNTQLANSDGIGVDVQGVYAGLALHATLGGAPFDVACANPARLDPGQRVTLALRVDMSHWFDGLDLAGAANDPDDTGIVISNDDNQILAGQLMQNTMSSFQLACANQ